MIHYSRFTALPLAFVCFAALAVSQNTKLFSLNIAAPKEPIKAGADLSLLVTVTNTSNRSISFIASPGELPEDSLLYSISVRGPQGRPAPPSASVGKRDPRIPVNYGSRVARTLAPGESFVDQVTVTAFYDLSRPGEYTISVARPFPPRQNLGKGTVRSNSIKVTVTK